MKTIQLLKKHPEIITGTLLVLVVLLSQLTAGLNLVALEAIWFFIGMGLFLTTAVIFSIKLQRLGKERKSYLLTDEDIL